MRSYAGDTLEEEFFRESDYARAVTIIAALFGHEHNWAKYHELLLKDLRQWRKAHER